MPAFTPQALYRGQLAVLGDQAGMARALRDLLPEGTTSNLRRLGERFRPGARPYASIWYQYATAPLGILRVDCFPEQPRATARRRAPDAAVGAAHPVLGWLSVTHLLRDPPIAGFRLHRKMHVTRGGTHYVPGRALATTIRLEQQRYRVQMARPGMIGAVARHMAALASVGTQLPVSLPDLLTVRPKLALIGFRSVPAAPLHQSGGGSRLEAIERVVRALCTVAAVIPTNEVTAQPANAYWAAVDTLQSLARTHPGFDDLCADLVARLTEAHARAGELQKVCIGPTQWRVWGVNEAGPVLRRAVLLRALPLPALQAELEAQANAHYAACGCSADSLHQTIDEVMTMCFGHQNARVKNLFAAQIDIRKADRAVQELAADGDATARALLLQALHRLSR
ncbi:MAG: hypothetical protein AAF458_09895 [Pseudomonadota bacterium]